MASPLDEQRRARRPRLL